VPLVPGTSGAIFRATFCDQKIAGSTPARSTFMTVTTLIKLFARIVPLSPNSVIWYRPKGSEATQGDAIKTGPPAILSHCKYSENSTTDLHGNWWTFAILYAEHSH